MDNREFAECISNALGKLKEKGIFQKDVARRIGFTESGLSKAKSYEKHKPMRIARLTREQILELILNAYNLSILEDTCEVTEVADFTELKEGRKLLYGLFRVIDDKALTVKMATLIFDRKKVTIEVDYGNSSKSVWNGEMQRLGTNIFIYINEYSKGEIRNKAQGLYCFYCGNSDSASSVFIGTYTRATRRGEPIMGKAVLMKAQTEDALVEMSKQIPPQVEFLLKDSLYSTPTVVPDAINNLPMDVRIRPFVGNYSYYSLGRRIGNDNNKDRIRIGKFEIKENQKAILEMGDMKYEGWIDAEQFPTFEIKLNLRDSLIGREGIGTYVMINASKYGRSKIYLPGLSMTTNDDNLPYSTPILLQAVENDPNYGKNVPEPVKNYFAKYTERIVCPSYREMSEFVDISSG